jgi:hypothetical protein
VHGASAPSRLLVCTVLSLYLGRFAGRRLWRRVIIERDPLEAPERLPELGWNVHLHAISPRRRMKCREGLAEKLLNIVMVARDADRTRAGEVEQELSVAGRSKRNEEWTWIVEGVGIC